MRDTQNLESPTPPSTHSAGHSRAETHLVWFLKFIGTSALVAFGAAVMPERWIVEIAEELGFDPFPDSPLTFYLARNLSLLYGFVGAALWLVALDLRRYRPLVFWAGCGTVLFGALQGIVDAMSGLPIWWTLGEALSTFFGGWLLLWLYFRALPSTSTGVEDDASR